MSDKMDEFFKKMFFYAGELVCLVLVGCGIGLAISLTMLLMRFMWTIV